MMMIFSQSASSLSLSPSQDFTLFGWTCFSSQTPQYCRTPLYCYCWAIHTLHVCILYDTVSTYLWMISVCNQFFASYSTMHSTHSTLHYAVYAEHCNSALHCRLGCSWSWLSGLFTIQPSSNLTHSSYFCNLKIIFKILFLRWAGVGGLFIHSLHIKELGGVSFKATQMNLKSSFFFSF